jgi:hypothetical protein
MLPIYTLARTPGATDTVEWTSICHSKQPFIMIHHSPTYEKSRWVHEERKRPFEVCYRSSKSVGWTALSHHATLAAAESASRRAAKEWAKFLADVQKAKKVGNHDHV